MGGTERREEVGDGATLRNKSVRPEAERCLLIERMYAGGQHDNANLRQRRSKLGQDLDSAPAGQRNTSTTTSGRQWRSRYDALGGDKEPWKNTDGEWQSRTEWHRVVLFGKLAEYGRTLAKGSHVMVHGAVRTREYDKDGVRHRVFELRADTIGKLDRAECREATEPLSDPE